MNVKGQKMNSITRREALKKLVMAGAALGAAPVIGKSSIGFAKDEHEEYCRLCEVLVHQSSMLIRKCEGRFHPFEDEFIIEVPVWFGNKISETRDKYGISIADFLRMAWPHCFFRYAPHSESIVRMTAWKFVGKPNSKCIGVHEFKVV